MTSTIDEERRAKRLARARKYRLAHKEEIRAYRIRTNDHRRTYNREWRAKNPAKARAKSKRDHVRWLLRYERQRIALIGRPMPSVCDICGETPGDRPLCADHSHKRGYGRGWLCDRCNLVLGAVGDDRDLLRKMIAYLTHHAAYQSPQLTLPGF